MREHINGVNRLLSFVILIATAMVVVGTAGAMKAPKEPTPIYASMTSGRG